MPQTAHTRTQPTQNEVTRIVHSVHESIQTNPEHFIVRAFVRRSSQWLLCLGSGREIVENVLSASHCALPFLSHFSSIFVRFFIGIRFLYWIVVSVLGADPRMHTQCSYNNMWWHNRFVAHSVANAGRRTKSKKKRMNRSNTQCIRSDSFMCSI